MPEGGARLRGHAAHDMGGDVRTGSRDHRYPMEQPAATLWYHDHRMDFTAPQVWRGLAGFHIIGDDDEDALSLPSGERDIPLMIVDRAFEEDGQFRYPAIDPTMLEEPGIEDAFMEGSPATSSWSTGHHGRYSRSTQHDTGCASSTPQTHAGMTCSSIPLRLAVWLSSKSDQTAGSSPLRSSSPPSPSPLPSASTWWWTSRLADTRDVSVSPREGREQLTL